MTTNDSALVKRIISNGGYVGVDPRVYQVVEFFSYHGQTMWGITWFGESDLRKMRYEDHNPPYVNEPKTIWNALLSDQGFYKKELPPEPKARVISFLDILEDYNAKLEEYNANTAKNKESKAALYGNPKRSRAED